MATEPFSHYVKFSELSGKVDGPVHLVLLVVGGSLVLFEGGRIGIKKIASKIKEAKAEASLPSDTNEHQNSDN